MYTAATVITNCLSVKYVCELNVKFVLKREKKNRKTIQLKWQNVDLQNGEITLNGKPIKYVIIKKNTAWKYLYLHFEL